MMKTSGSANTGNTTQGSPAAIPPTIERAEHGTLEAAHAAQHDGEECLYEKADTDIRGEPI